MRREDGLEEVFCQLVVRRVQLGLLALACAMTVRADVISAAGGVGQTQNSTARHAAAAGGPTGTYDLDGKSSDSRGTNGSGAGASVSTGGAYAACPPTCADAAGPTKDPGLRYDPQARPQISWGPGFWDSGGSYAKISKGPVPDSTLPETALAIAFVTDPQYFAVTFDSAFRPQIDFSLSILAGASLTATSASPGEMSSSMFAGTFDTSLLAGDLWSFSWTADSAHPSESVFHFSSNPALGLNDASIESTFNSLLSDSGGTHTLTSSFNVSGTLFPALPPGSFSLDYSTGGETTLEANAAIAPEPEAFWLLGAGLASLAVRRFLGRRLITAQMSRGL